MTARDRFIGWSHRQRGQRFLILPWVRVPHLAAHLLTLALPRLSDDWQRRYGHPLWLVETFVERGRFASTAYKAAGWSPVGQTTAFWSQVFAQPRPLQRAIALGLGLLCGVGKRTLTRAISFQCNTQKDWSADYKLFSRSPWAPRELFDPMLEPALQEHCSRRLVVSVADTRLWRTGKHAPQTQWQRDPLGPPFQTKLRWGHRFLQPSLVLLL